MGGHQAEQRAQEAREKERLREQLAEMERALLGGQQKQRELEEAAAAAAMELDARRAAEAEAKDRALQEMQ